MISMTEALPHGEHKEHAQANNPDILKSSLEQETFFESGGGGQVSSLISHSLEYWQEREREAEAAAIEARRRQLDVMDPEEAKRFLLTPRDSAPEDGLPSIISAKDLVAKSIPEPPQLIKGLVHQGSKMVLGGGSKSYKTWSLLDLGMSVATGTPWWGFETTQSKVLYINLELPDWAFKERLDAIRASRPEVTDLEKLHVWNLRGYAVSFDEMRPKIVARVAEGYGLIIIDPIYKVYGSRDENSAGEMGELLNEIECLAVKSNAAVVFGAHFSKGNQSGKESIDRISGSGVFARDPDTILVMTKHELEDTYTVDATLRNLKPVAPFCVQRVHPLMERNDAVDPQKLKKPGMKTEQYPVALLLKSLGVDELTTTEWQDRTCKDSGMKSRTFMAKLAEIKDNPDSVTKNKDGKWKATYPILPPGWKSSFATADQTNEEVQKCN